MRDKLHVTAVRGGCGETMQDVIGTLLRRWYLTLAGIIGTILLCFVAANTVSPTYQASAAVVLFPPLVEAQPDAGGQQPVSNPYLQLAGLEQAVDVLSRTMNSQKVAGEVANEAPDGSYVTARDVATTGPILNITATSDTPVGALATLSAAETRVQSVLVNLQENERIEPRYYITSSILTSDATAVRVGKQQLRAVIFAAGVGLVGTAGVVAIVDAVLAARRSRRKTLAGSESDDGGFESADVLSESDDDGYESADVLSESDDDGYESADVLSESDDDGYESEASPGEDHGGLMSSNDSGVSKQ